MYTATVPISPQPIPRSPERPSGFTYRDYRRIEERVELINGVIYLMSSPSEKHQWVITKLIIQLGTQLEGHPCVPYVAPLDVRLFYAEDDSDDTVVQPDLMIVCDPAKRGGGFIKGAPDFIIEILSPSTIRKDMIEKRRLYETAGVKEYWTIDPENRVLTTYLLTRNHTYTTEVCSAEGTIAVSTLGLTIDFFRVFGPVEDETTPLPPAAGTAPEPVEGT